MLGTLGYLTLDSLGQLEHWGHLVIGVSWTIGTLGSLGHWGPLDIGVPWILWSLGRWVSSNIEVPWILGSLRRLDPSDIGLPRMLVVSDKFDCPSVSLWRLVLRESDINLLRIISISQYFSIIFIRFLSISKHEFCYRTQEATTDEFCASWIFSLHACTDGTARIFWFASRVQSPQILALSSTFATLSLET